MIPWWAVLIALVVFGIWTVLAAFAGAAIAQSAREKADVALAAAEERKWQVPDGK